MGWGEHRGGGTLTNASSLSACVLCAWLALSSCNKLSSRPLLLLLAIPETAMASAESFGAQKSCTIMTIVCVNNTMQHVNDECISILLNSPPPEGYKDLQYLIECHYADCCTEGGQQGACGSVQRASPIL